MWKKNTKINTNLNDRYHLNNGKIIQFIKYEHHNIAHGMSQFESHSDLNYLNSAPNLEMKHKPIK